MARREARIEPRRNFKPPDFHQFHAAADTRRESAKPGWPGWGWGGWAPHSAFAPETLLAEGTQPRSVPMCPDDLGKSPLRLARSVSDGIPSLSLGDMESCYAYVNLLARASAYRCFQIRLDPEDLAHEAIIRVQAKWQQLRSADPASIQGWLRSVVSSVLHDLTDRALAERRDIRKVQSLDAALDESSARVDAFLVPRNTSTPSRLAVRLERATAVDHALGRLPEDQRTAIELHHLSGFTLDETASRMNRSSTSVAGLLRRGLKTLRAKLANCELVTGGHTTRTKEHP